MDQGFKLMLLSIARHLCALVLTVELAVGKGVKVFHVQTKTRKSKTLSHANISAKVLLVQMPAMLRSTMVSVVRSRILVAVAT